MKTIPTLQEFRSTRCAVSDLAETCGIDPEYFENGPCAGFVYEYDVGAHVYIEQRDNGTFYLLIDRDDWCSVDLEELEGILYQRLLEDGAFEESV